MNTVNSHLNDEPIGKRHDLRVVADLIEAGSRVLDIGCGDGELLAYLGKTKGVTGRGIEIRQDRVNNCVAAGLSVIQGDANADLSLYPTGSFDYVVLTQTLQAVDEPKTVLRELVRIGRYAIVAVPNYGFWRIRMSLLVRGRMPSPDGNAYPWYESHNIHPCTIQDFTDLVTQMSLTIEQEIVLNAKGRVSWLPTGSRRNNLFGKQAVFLLCVSNEADYQG